MNVIAHTRVFVGFLTTCAMVACGSPDSAPGAGANGFGLARHPVSGYIYVANSSGVGKGSTGEILTYATAANGNASPVNAIGGSQTQLTQVNGIVVNSSGEIYVVDTDTNEIVGFAPGASGNVAPNVVISGPSTNLACPIGLAIDASGYLYVANGGSSCRSGSPPPGYLVFAPGSNGDASPTYDVTGTYTDLFDSNGIAVDAEGYVYVSQSGQVNVFAPGSNGDATPLRELDGSKTLLNQPWGIGVYASRMYVGSCGGFYLERFASGASGNTPPAAVISGSRTHLRSCIDGVTVGSKGTLYAVTLEPNPAIYAFATFAKGNRIPKTYIRGPSTRLTDPVYLYVAE